MGPEAAGRLVVVDAMNVIGAGAGGWWRDRAGAQRRLQERLAGLARRSPGPVMVVYEGTPVDELAEGRHGDVEVRWARHRGAGAADDRIVEEVATARGEGVAVTVVTADRGLRSRVEALGATVVGPRRLEAAVAGE
ncbi:MAG TPA: NYN domain-containing protein [Acidimicrobiales bacterium]